MTVPWIVGPFHAIGIFLYPLKTENVWSSDFFLGGGGILSDKGNVDLGHNKCMGSSVFTQLKQYFLVDINGTIY